MTKSHPLNRRHPLGVLPSEALESGQIVSFAPQTRSSVKHRLLSRPEIPDFSSCQAQSWTLCRLQRATGTFRSAEAVGVIRRLRCVYGLILSWSFSSRNSPADALSVSVAPVPFHTFSCPCFFRLFLEIIGCWQAGSLNEAERLLMCAARLHQAFYLGSAFATLTFQYPVYTWISF
jgi:hypothetical protein